jgi:hypothetical protein
MSWQTYRLVFRMESPLHVGWRNTGNLMQTRPYLPGRVLWGAVTASLTQRLGENDYHAVGEWVREQLRFGYFFLARDPDEPLYPAYLGMRQQPGIYYGQEEMPEVEFERFFLSSLASTAIAHDANVAQEGSLHELEFLVPSLGLGQPVYLVGHLCAQSGSGVVCQDNDVVARGLPLYEQGMAALRVGGERRYGFGRLTLCQDQCRKTDELFGYRLDQENDSLIVTIPVRKPLLAHAIADSVSVRGSLEPLVSREWAVRHGPGRQVTLLGLCYVPGSVAATETAFRIGHYGIWEEVV